MEELTFNDLPKAVSQLLLEIKEIKELLKTLQPPKPTNKPILIDRACEIIGKSRPTIYKLSRLGEIPSYRQGERSISLKTNCWLGSYLERNEP